MSTFKIKGDKKYIHDTRITVDAKHQNMINNFKKKKKNLPTLKILLQNLKKKLTKLKKVDNAKLTCENLNNKIKYKQKIKKLEKEIESIENNTEMNNYFFNTGHILYKYYENKEGNKHQEVNLKKILPTLVIYGRSA